MAKLYKLYQWNSRTGTWILRAQSTDEWEILRQQATLLEDLEDGDPDSYLKLKTTRKLETTNG